MIANNLGATRAQQFASSLIALLGVFPKHESNDIAATEKELAAMSWFGASQLLLLPFVQRLIADAKRDDQLRSRVEPLWCQAWLNVELWGFCKIFVFEVVNRHAMTYSTSAINLRRPLNDWGVRTRDAIRGICRRAGCTTTRLFHFPHTKKSTDQVCSPFVSACKMLADEGKPCFCRWKSPGTSGG